MTATWRHSSLAFCVLSLSCGGGRARYAPPGLDGGDARDAAPDAGQPGDSGADAARDAGCRDDADNDGVVSPECGGRDCNDGDPAIRPRADDPGSWQFEAADELGWAATPSLVVAADGAPSVVFADRATDEVVVANRTADGAWVRELVEALAREPSMTTDTDGVPHALFVSRRADPPELRHATRDPAAGWQAVTVVPGTPSHTPRRPALAPLNLNLGQVDLNPGEVVGAYVDEGQQSDIVRFLGRDGAGGWSVEDVAEDGGQPQPTDGPVAVAVNLGGVPWLTWTNAAVLRVASRQADGWAIETVPIVAAASAPAIAVGRDGAVVVSYFDVAAGAVAIARRALDGTWATEVIDDRDTPGAPSAVALDGAGLVQLLYYVPERFDTRWATDAHGGWLRLTIDRGSEADLAIAIDHQGAVHMAYATSDSDLNWARHVGGDGIDQDCSGLPDDGDDPAP